jgi:CRISPR-associated endoribonuclease Cas6/Csy4 subtype I-F
MKPSCYVDLRLALPPADNQHGSGVSITVMARLLFILHGTMRTIGRNHPVALPQMRTGDYRHPGHVIRVFGSSADELMQVTESMAANAFMRDYAQIGRTRPVPAGVSKFVEYQRFRIPGRKSRLQESRQRRLAEGDRLPYLRLSSPSTGQAFSLRVRVIEHANRSEDCEPDSYGLSVPTRPFAVPDLPA